MRVGVISYGLDMPARAASGIGRYTFELLQALQAQSQLQLTVLTAGAPALLADLSRLQRVPLPGCRLLPGLLALGNLWMPSIARRQQLDVVHDPTGVAPFLFGAGPARTVVTVHDVFAWSVPGHSTLVDTLIYRHWLPRLLPRVDAAITVSQASKADIVKYLKMPEDRVHVVYEGVNVGYRPLNAGEAADTAAGHGLPAGYILFLGSVEKRKNVHGLLQAYARLRQMGEQRPLVIVGLRRSSAAIEQPLRELDLHPHVIFTGYLPDQDLPAIYSAADIFVFPSLYEGFGLPPLEAMACGTPVVCSHAGSLPEVVGDAAITVDPHDIEGLAEAMRRVLDDQVLRQELREKGLARARLFSWEKAARQTIEVYQQVLNGAPTPAHVPEER